MIDGVSYFSIGFYVFQELVQQRGGERDVVDLVFMEFDQSVGREFNQVVFLGGVDVLVYQNVYGVLYYQ